MVVLGWWCCPSWTLKGSTLGGVCKAVAQSEIGQEVRDVGDGVLLVQDQVLEVGHAAVHGGASAEDAIDRGQLEGADVLIVDPPRKGLGPVSP